MSILLGLCWYNSLCIAFCIWFIFLRKCRFYCPIPNKKNSFFHQTWLTTSVLCHSKLQSITELTKNKRYQCCKTIFTKWLSKSQTEKLFNERNLHLPICDGVAVAMISCRNSINKDAILRFIVELVLDWITFIM